MTFDDFDHLMSGLSSVVTIGAVVVGGIWAYRRFIRNREACPKIEFTVDVNFVHWQGGKWIVEALAFLDNKGLVKQSISRFTFDLRYTLPTDPIRGRDEFLVYVPHKATDGSWLPKNWESTFVEPGLSTRYSCLASIPEDATTVLIHGKFFYESNDWHTADKLLKVPRHASEAATEKLQVTEPEVGSVSD